MTTGNQSDMYSRLRGYLPRGWFGSNSDPTPMLAAVLNGLAFVLSFVYSLYGYAKLQTRIATATDGWLDIISADFFGNTLPRKASETDSSFRSRILANLSREKATRYGNSAALTALTGRAPVIVEPWRPLDCGAYVGNPRALLVGATLYRQDWQGNQQLYPTPRTNYANLSNAIQGWAANVAGTTLTGGSLAPDGTATACKIGITGTSISSGCYRSNVGGGYNPAIGTTVYYGCFFQYVSGVSSIQLSLEGSAFSVLSNKLRLDPSTGLVISVGSTVASYRVVQIPGTTWFYAELSAVTSSAGYLSTSVYSGQATGAANICAWGSWVSTIPCSAYIISPSNSSVTVTDYAIDIFGNVSLASSLAVGAVLSVTSPSDGLAAGYVLGIGNGYQASFYTNKPLAGPFGPGFGYNTVGSYGSLSYNAQAFITVYRPTAASNFGNIGGYDISVGGYAVGSQLSYISLNAFTGGVSDSDIYATVAATKAEGTTMWVRISN